MSSNIINSDTVHYCTIISDAQWNFLLEGRFSSLRQRCLHRLMTYAVRARTVYKIKGVDIALEVGQVAASDVELAAYLECNRKTVGKLIASFNTLGMLTTRTNNRTSIHTLHFLTGWYVGGVLLTNPHYIRPAATAKGQTTDARTPVHGASQSTGRQDAAPADSQAKGHDADSMTTGADPNSSSLHSDDGTVPSSGVTENGDRQPPSASGHAAEPGNPHTVDSEATPSGEDAAGSHSEAQDGADGSKGIPS